MAKIIKEANLKDELGDIIRKYQKSDKEGQEIDIEGAGVDAIMTVVACCGDDRVEQRIYDLLDDVFGKKFAEMELDEIAESFKELAQKNNLLSFFKSAGLLKQ